MVEYWADDKSGFNAVVKRLGPNLHPTGPIIAPYRANIPIISSPHAVPISVGPVAKLGGLAGAPLLQGSSGAPLLHGPIYTGHKSPALAEASLLARPIHGTAVSSATVYKAPPIAVKSIAPLLLQDTILPGPIIKAPLAPLEHGPLLSYPNIKSVPNYRAEILPAPILPAPILPAPILPAPLLPAQIIKAGPILRDYPVSGVIRGPLVQPSYFKGPVLEPFYEKGPLLESSYVKGPLYEPDLIRAPLIEPAIPRGRLAYDSIYERGLLERSQLDRAPLLRWGDLDYGKQ